MVKEKRNASSSIGDSLYSIAAVQKQKYLQRCEEDFEKQIKKGMTITNGSRSLFTARLNKELKESFWEAGLSRDSTVSKEQLERVLRDLGFLAGAAR